MHGFTPLPSLAGGVLIGLATSLLLLANGRVAGISGIFGGLLVPKPGDAAWRVFFLAGLVLGGLALFTASPARFGPPTSALPVVALGGVIVGFGTRLGNGCTSGHGVCGLARFSLRSLVATMTFMLAAGVTVYVTRHVLGVGS
jgi:uncharacterized membrane protein YedE/YeeE